MRLNDAVLGLVLLIFAAAMMAYTTTFPAMPGQNYGPALFPMLIGAGMAICGLLLIAQGLRARRAAGGRLVAWTAPAGGGVNLLLVLAALVFYILASDWLGFIPTAILILTPLLLRLGTRPAAALAVAVAATLVIHTLFARLLLVPLPWGLLAPVAW